MLKQIIKNQSRLLWTITGRVDNLWVIVDFMPVNAFPYNCEATLGPLNWGVVYPKCSHVSRFINCIVSGKGKRLNQAYHWMKLTATELFSQNEHSLSHAHSLSTDGKYRFRYAVLETCWCTLIPLWLFHNFEVWTQIWEPHFTLSNSDPPVYLTLPATIFNRSSC